MHDPPVKTTSPEHPPSKRSAICNAALILFSEKGVAATTTRAIAKSASTAEGNLYRHFKNKEDLVRVVFDQSASRFHEVLVGSRRECGSAAEKLADLIGGIFVFADLHNAAFKLLLSVHHTGVLKNRKRASQPLPMQLFAATIRKGTAQGIFREVDPVLATGWIVSMTQRAIVFHESDVIALTRAKVISETVGAAIRLLSTDS